jgi:hypothetical protein
MPSARGFSVCQKTHNGSDGTSYAVLHFSHSRNSLAALGKLRPIRESREQTKLKGLGPAVAGSSLSRLCGYESV